MAAAAGAATERTMQTIRLNTVELLEIVRPCGSLQVDKCPAPFLRDYLAAGLVTRDLELAAKALPQRPPAEPRVHLSCNP
jgi:hypothetical protein